MRDAAHLDASAIVPSGNPSGASLDVPVVALLLHVDEVDNDQPREIAQAKLACDLLGGLQLVW